MTQPLTFPVTSPTLVSIILPSRGRPAELIESVNSILYTAVNKDKIEFLFRADNDDLATIDACHCLMEKLPHAQLWVSPRDKGYLEMHRWTYTLAKLAQSDWLLLWNDDAHMVTPQWDHLLLHAGVASWHNVPDNYMLVCKSKNRLGCNEFMFLRKKMVDYLGHISLSPHSDNWLMRVFTAIQSVTFLPIEVDHFSQDMNDKTREESVAAYANGKLAQETLESPQAQQAIRNDAQKLLSYILSHNTSGVSL